MWYIIILQLKIRRICAIKYIIYYINHNDIAYLCVYHCTIQIALCLLAFINMRQFFFSFLFYRLFIFVQLKLLSMDIFFGKLLWAFSSRQKTPHLLPFLSPAFLSLLPFKQLLKYSLKYLPMSFFRYLPACSVLNYSNMLTKIDI